MSYKVGYGKLGYYYFTLVFLSETEDLTLNVIASKDFQSILQNADPWLFQVLVIATDIQMLWILYLVGIFFFCFYLFLSQKCTSNNKEKYLHGIKSAQ